VFFFFFLKKISIDVSKNTRNLQSRVAQQRFQFRRPNRSIVKQNYHRDFLRLLHLLL